ncbi:MAG: ABC transporter ATP-binding protein [Gloeobacterales cyanobacterium]
MTRQAAPSSLQVLLEYLRPHQKEFWSGVFFLLCTTLLGATIPWFIKNAIDDLRKNLDYHQLLLYAGAIFGMATLMLVIRVISRIYLFRIGRQVEFDLKGRIFDHLLLMSPSYFSINPAGDLISRATSDVDNIRRLLGFSVLSILNAIFTYSLTVPFMLAVDVQLTLLALSVYPIMFGTVALVGGKLRNQQNDVQQRLSGLSTLLQEDLNGIALIKVYAQEENEEEAFGRQNKQLLEANLNLARTQNTLFPLLGALAGVSLLVLLWAGGPKLAEGTLSIGGLTALTVYIAQLIFPTALLGFTITSFQRGQVSIERVENILATPPAITDRPDAIPLHNPKGALEVRGLTFRHANTSIPTLQDIHLQVPIGSTVALVGPVGSGKTTLAHIFPHLLEIAPNQVFLDGQDITRIRLADLRRAIAMVPQESFLFSTTVADNIRYGKPDLDLEAVIEVAQEARVHEEIMSFPQGYQTLVGERGITLSGGQRQRIALARALLMDAPVLILDDALSSVDNETAEAILENLKRRQKKTVLLITHRLSASARADWIAVMDQGHMVQQGSHYELLREQGLYRKLWEQSQMIEGVGGALEDRIR